jgi:hypothetical protein
MAGAKNELGDDDVIRTHPIRIEGLTLPKILYFQVLLFNIGENIKSFLYDSTVGLFKRIVRRGHVSDDYLESLCFNICDYLLPKIEAYQKYCLNHSIEYRNEEWQAWNTLLNENMEEILFALRFGAYAYDSRRKSKKFFLQYYGKDPFADEYNIDDGIVANANKRARKGFELFGKYWYKFKSPFSDSKHWPWK